MSRIVLLVVLLGVFAWRIQSCHAEVREKRLAAARQNQRFDTRTAEAESTLPLDPYARRAAMAEQMRLKPDARFLLAAGRLSGSAPSVSWRDGKWSLRGANGEELGAVDELASFSQIMDVLGVLAKKHPPARGQVSSLGPALQWEPEARAALTPSVAKYEATQDAAALHAAARAAISLSFYEVDAVQADDALAGRAMALFALDAASGTSDTTAERALLAAALGYSGEAQPAGEPSLRHYLSRDRAALREDATLREATPSDRYLYLRSLLDDGDGKGAVAFLDSALGVDRFTLANVVQLTRAPEMADFSDAAFALPSFLLADSPPAARFEGRTVKALRNVAEAFRVDPAAVPALEAATAKAGAETRGYLRALWMTALARQGDYWLDGQSNAATAKAFSDALAHTDSSTVRTFQSYFELRRQASIGHPLAAIEATAALSGIGGAARVKLVSKGAQEASYGDPRAVRAARKLVAQLDARVEHRRLLGELAWSVLQDLRTTQRMSSSAIAAAPLQSMNHRIWFASLSGDEHELQRIAADKTLPGFLRLQAAESARSPKDAETALRALVDEQPDDYHLVSSLVEVLWMKEHDPAAASEVVAQWLRRNDGRSLEAGDARGELSFFAYVQGHYQDGLEFAAPAVELVGNAGAIQAYALNAAGLGHAEDAHAAIGFMAKRYPGPSTAADTAEVEWVLNDLPAAARAIAAANLTPTQAQSSLGRKFTRFFGKKPPLADAAAQAMASAGVSASVLDELGRALDEANDFEAAVKVREAATGNADAMLALQLHTSSSIRNLRGDQAARDYLREHLQLKNDDEARRVAVMSFREADQRLLWDVLPDPVGSGEGAEQLWLLRAAALARQGKDAPKEQLAATRAHYAAVREASRHASIGRYLVGDLPEAEVAKLVTNIPGTCEVPFYFASRAQGQGDRVEAADWYSVALECGVRSEAEYGWAYDALYRWRGGADPLAGFAKKS